MKIFIPASSTTDSTALLYHVLKNTDHEVISRIIRVDTGGEDLEQHPYTCGWLKDNVRDFDYGYSESEKIKYKNIVDDVHYNMALLANQFKVDCIYMGYNSFNWSQSNWFFNTDTTLEDFYRHDNKFIRPRSGHLALSDNTDIPIYWPFMNRDSKPMGRWETFETIPTELRKLTSSGCNRCGHCNYCKVRYMYYLLKKAGRTTEEIDDLIQKAGRYGKYFNPNDLDYNGGVGNVQNRNRAFINLELPKGRKQINEIFEFGYA